MEHNHISETAIWDYISKTADIETIKKVERWINSDHYNEKLFNEISTIYKIVGKNPYANNLDIDTAKTFFFKSLKAKKNKQYQWKGIFKYAAVLALLITTATYTYLQFFIDNEHIVLQTTYGNQKQVYLPDGSVVWLNASSKLSYNLKSPRTLHLEGEAYFEVAKNKNSPFTVTTHDNHKIKALGTSFNIKSYTANAYTETVLLTGKVEVTSNDHLDKKIILLPNEKVTFYKKDKRVIKSTLENAIHTIAWKKREIRFNNKSFKEIANDIYIQYNIKLHFENEEISNSKFTGSFDQTTPINEVLEILKTSKHFEFQQIKKNEWLIK